MYLNPILWTKELVSAHRFSSHEWGVGGGGGGTILSRGCLPKVEAPRHPRHPTSIKSDAVVKLLGKWKTWFMIATDAKFNSF